MRKLLHVLLAVGAVGMAVLFAGGKATAGQDDCHNVRLSATNNPGDEGEIITIRVLRDGIEGTTSFRIKTVNGSAEGGKDYPSFNEKLTWTTASGLQAKNYELRMADDAIKEGEETFRIELSEPGGTANCTPVSFVNNNMTVRIKASDQGATPAPTAAPTAAPTTRPTSSATTSPSPSPTVSPSPSPTPTGTPLATFTPFPSATPSGDDDGLSGLDIAGIAIGAGALAAGGLLWYLRSRGAV